MTPNTPPRKKRPAGVLAALDRRGGAWRLAIARPGAVVERESFQDLAPLAARLDQAGVSRLIRTAPARECLARLEPAPDASGEDLAPALALIADAALPEDIPAHRRAASTVGPLALAAGWAARDDAAPRLNLPGLEETWATEPAAWLAFASEETGALLAWDRELGSVFAARLSPDKPLARCIRLDPADQAAWSRGLAAAGASVGLAATDAPSGVVTAGPLITGGWQGVTASAIAGEFGPALGALRLALDDPHHGAHAGPAGLRRAEDDGREPLPTRAARWVSHPARTPWLIAAAATLVVASPVAFAYARLKIVEAKLAALGPAQEKREALAREAALYRQMDASRWPMTKLFADLANATPVGVTVDNLSIEHEGGQGITVKGHADSAEVLNTFQRNLNQTGILTAVRLGSIDADSSGVSFQVQARVASAKTISRVTDDFGKKTLSTRLWVEGSGPKTLPPEHTAGEEDPDHGKGPELATNESPSAAPSENGGAGSGGDRRGSGPGRRNGRDNGPRAGRPENASSSETNKAAKPMEVPPPLSQAELDAMDKSAAVKAWAERRSAAQRDSTSPEDKARLEEEVKKLEAKWKGGAS